MWKNRVGYLLILLGCAFLFYQSGQIMVGVALAALLLQPVLMGVGLLLGSKSITMTCKAAPGGVVDRGTTYLVTVQGGRHLWAVRELLLEAESENAMTGEVRRYRFLLPMQGRNGSYSRVFQPDVCGEIRIRCVRASIRDHLKLFSRSVPSFPPIRTVVYPEKRRVDVSLSRQTVGAPREDGAMQNRQGGDHSEMFDIREYTPGDDIRSIHWKLSVKTDTLVLRQPSTPSLYDLAVLPDFGMDAGEEPLTQERNGAIAYGVAVLEQLCTMGLQCCLMLPLGGRLDVYPISNQKELEDAITAWMCAPLPKNSGDGLHYFLNQRMGGQFSRLLVLNAGKFHQGQEAQGCDLAVTVVSTVTDLEQNGKVVQNGNVSYVELPAKPQKDTAFLLSC